MQSILLPDGYTFPFNATDDADLNAYVVEIGYKVYQYNKKYQDALNKARYSFIQSELKEEYEQSLKDAAQKHEQSIKSITEEFDKSKIQLMSKSVKLAEEYEQEIKTLQEKLNAKIMEQEKQAEEKIKMLQTKLSEAEQHIEEKNKLMQTRYEQSERRLHKLEEENRDKIRKIAEEELIKNKSLQTEINELRTARLVAEKELRSGIEKTYQDTINVERERWNALNMQYTYLASTVASKSTTVGIGNVGEEMITTWVRDLFNTVEITDTSGLTAKGDLHVKIQNKVFLIEVKNRISVQRADIEKFVRDIESNISDIHGGLFISLNSPAIPNKGDFTLEYIGEIPVIYLHVPDRQTLKVAIKSLLFLNNKTDSTLLSMIINQIYGNLKSVSAATVSMSKNLDDSKVSLDSLKRDIRKTITQLDQLFEENPHIKIDSTSQAIEFTAEEIKKINDVYVNNKKAKMSDYISALNVNAKYLQDRGGASRIKAICSSVMLPNFKLDLTSLH